MKLALTGALPLYLALLCAKVIPANATCYNLDRSEAPDDVPCQTSGTSNCCNKKDICLTNGLCYLQGSPPNALSRGSCTDMNWGPACYAPCSDTNRKSGYPIINMGYDTTNPRYCCGSVDGNGCQVGDPFTIDNGAVIPGVAALAGYSNSSSITNTTCSNSSSIPTSSNSSSTTSCPSITNTTCPTGNSSSSSSHNVAIGVGVGVPLGIIALASIAWALWERRQCKYARLESAPPTGAQAIGQHQYPYPPHSVYQAHPAELATRPTKLVSELDSNGGTR